MTFFVELKDRQGPAFSSTVLHGMLGATLSPFGHRFVAGWTTYVIHPFNAAACRSSCERMLQIFISQQSKSISTMARVLFFLALLVASAQAFVTPANNAGELAVSSRINLSL